MLKLWVGVFDATERTLTYIAAGHGCAMTVSLDGRSELLPAGAGRAVGIKPDAEFRAQTVALVPGLRALILTDGFVEQRVLAQEDEQHGGRSADEPDDQPQHFGIGRIEACLLHNPLGGDELEALFAGLEQHAGTTVFDDDATAVLVRW